ncbi:MAG: uroporphyrinogen-III synthase [Gammaproteobacteria bacterium]|nr:uroporphyrinogen-III synthase [Gammaproteobacteria bacterium]
MPVAELHGVTVVITRPAKQAGSLAQLINIAGGHVIHFPVLEITDPSDDASLNAVLERLAQFDIAIFISPNAVDRGMSRLSAWGGLPPTLKVAAVGKGSAKQLASYGHKTDIFPTQKFNSEALLAMPAMQAVAGKRIVIFRGEGGRELLATTLQQRGAQVVYAECYRRTKPATDSSELMQRWAQHDIDLIVVTSNEGLHNLYDMVGALGRKWLIKTSLVVVSERSVALAQSLGFEKPPLLAEQASDASILAAICSWQPQQ